MPRLRLIFVGTLVIFLVLTTGFLTVIVKFEVLTLVPIDLDALLPEQMTFEEREQLNNYHQLVYKKISPYLPEAEKEWLKHYTRAV